MLLNNFNSADLPPGYVLLEDRREQGRVLFHLEAGGRVRVLESPLLDKMTPDRKLYLDSLGVFIPHPGRALCGRWGQNPENRDPKRRLLPHPAGETADRIVGRRPAVRSRR